MLEENYKTLVREIKEELSKWRAIPCSWIGKLNIVKLSVFPNLIYKFSAIKIPVSYFRNTGKLIMKFIWRGKSCRTASIILKYKNKILRLLKTYYKAAVREGTGDPLQYSCLENPMDGGAW